MPLNKDDLDGRGELAGGEWRETDDVPVSDLVYNLAESISHAQTKLDLNAAEVMEVLDETTVDVVPHITRRVDEDGTVTVEKPDPEERSLLELGFTPARYHFSEATIEVSFDAKLSEEEVEEGSNRAGMRAGTSEARQHRKFNRSVETNTSVTATLEPMAPPTGLSPSTSTEPASETAGAAGSETGDDGGDGATAGDDGGVDDAGDAAGQSDGTPA